jgi:hypothetical protein
MSKPAYPIMESRMFEEESDVAVLDPPCIPKKSKTVYINDLLSAAAGMKSPALSDLRGKELLDSVLSQPKNGKDIPRSSPGDRYVNMSELIEELHEREGLDIFDVAERVNGYVVTALRENRKITISFKDAEASEPILGDVIGDIYVDFPEELIDSNLKLVDIAPRWRGALATIIRQERLHRDDPASFICLMDKLCQIAEGDY